MRRPQVNLLIDILAFVALTILAATGIMMHYVLPPGTGHWSTLLGWNRHDWGIVHFYSAVVFLAVLVIHLILHWQWIVAMVRGKPREGSHVRVLLGLFGLIMLLLLVSLPFFFPVDSSGNIQPEDGHGRSQRQTDSINQDRLRHRQSE